MTSSIASSKLPLRLLLDTSQHDQRICLGRVLQYSMVCWVLIMLFSKGISDIAVALDNLLDYHGKTICWAPPCKSTDKRRQFQEPTKKHHVSKINFSPSCETQNTKAQANKTTKSKKHIRQKCKMTDNHVLWVWTMSHPPFIVYCLSNEQHWMIQLICQALNYKRRITFQLAHFACTRHKTTVCEIMCFFAATHGVSLHNVKYMQALYIRINN